MKLGQTLKDKVTGFTGIATAKVEYLSGCVQFGLQPEIDKEGKVPDAAFFDFQRLEIVADKAQLVLENKAEALGGPGISIRRGT
jgi:hypothetical protein